MFLKISSYSCGVRRRKRRGSLTESFPCNEMSDIGAKQVRRRDFDKAATSRFLFFF